MGLVGWPILICKLAERCSSRPKQKPTRRLWKCRTPVHLVTENRASGPRRPSGGTTISRFIPDIPDDEPRLYFQLMSGKRVFHIHMPIESEEIQSLPHAQEVLVYGCKKAGYISSFVIIPLEDGQPIVHNVDGILTCSEDD